MSLIPRCVVCDAPLNPYGGGSCCGGTFCKRYEPADGDKLTLSERDPVKAQRRAA